MIRSSTQNLLAILDSNVHGARIALDIGGSCLKMAYLHPEGCRYSEGLLAYLREHQVPHLTHQTVRGMVHFMSFETEQLDKCLMVLETSTASKHKPVIYLTGGGAEHYKTEISKRLKATAIVVDEMDSLVAGIRYFISCKDTYHYHSHTDTRRTRAIDPLKKCIVVNFGTGVSIVEISPKTTDSNSDYTRVGGSSIGGGTFWGLCKLVMDCPDFDELLAMCLRGNHNKVDMLVKDIYRGKNYDRIGLSGNTVASSLGKALRRDNQTETVWEKFSDLVVRTAAMWSSFFLELPGVRDVSQYLFGGSRAASIWMGKYRSADVANSVLYMICMNVAQLAVLYADKCGSKQIVFSGSFVKDHKEIIGVLTDAIDYWTKGQVHAVFTKHHAYTSCIGCLSKVLEQKNVLEE
jgi:pantothenate kinase